MPSLYLLIGGFTAPANPRRTSCSTACAPRRPGAWQSAAARAGGVGEGAASSHPRVRISARRRLSTVFTLSLWPLKSSNQAYWYSARRNRFCATPKSTPAPAVKPAATVDLEVVAVTPVTSAPGEVGQLNDDHRTILIVAGFAIGSKAQRLYTTAVS